MAASLLVLSKAEELTLDAIEHRDGRVRISGATRAGSGALPAKGVCQLELK